MLEPACIYITISATVLCVHKQLPDCSVAVIGNLSLPATSNLYIVVYQHSLKRVFIGRPVINELCCYQSVTRLEFFFILIDKDC